VGANSDLHLSLLNTFVAGPAAASLSISAPHRTFRNPTPSLPARIEGTLFSDGFTSEVVYEGVSNVTHL
jgi:hypothetical protein